MPNVLLDFVNPTLTSSIFLKKLSSRSIIYAFFWKEKKKYGLSKYLNALLMRVGFRIK